MTRINVVPVQCLSDKHLLAEYRELPRIFTAVSKLLDEGKELGDIPDSYRLGKGHVRFFYNKLPWLRARYFKLMRELTFRGVRLNMLLFHKVGTSFLRTAGLTSSPAQVMVWSPSPEDMYLNMARLVKRSNFDAAKEEALNAN